MCASSFLITAKDSLPIFFTSFCKSSLSAATYLSKYGYQVTILEKNKSFGGRARKFNADGFTFDMGPSWYWMPDVFEKFFNDFGKTTNDFYKLKKLNS